MTVDLNPKEPMPAPEENVPGAEAKVESDCPSSEEDKENVTEVVENENSSESESRNEEPAEDDLCTIWVGQLHRNVTEEILYELFLQAGPLISARIPNDKEGKKRSFGFVEFVYDVSVPYAMALFEGTKLFGREIRMNSKNPERINVERLRREMVYLIQQNQRQKIAASFSNCPDSKDYQRTSEPTVTRPLMNCTIPKPPLLPLPLIETGQRPRPLLENASWQSPQLGRGLLGAYPGHRGLIDTGPPNVDPWPPLMFQPRPRETAPFMMRPPPPDWNGMRGPCPPRPPGMHQRNVHFNEDPRRYGVACQGRMERDMRFFNNYPQGGGGGGYPAKTEIENCSQSTDTESNVCQVNAEDSDKGSSLKSVSKTAVCKAEDGNTDLYNSDPKDIEITKDIGASSKKIPDNSENKNKDKDDTNLTNAVLGQLLIPKEEENRCITKVTSDFGTSQDSKQIGAVDTHICSVSQDMNIVANNTVKINNTCPVANDIRGSVVGCINNNKENDLKDIPFIDRETPNFVREEIKLDIAKQSIPPANSAQNVMENGDEFISAINNQINRNISEKSIENSNLNFHGKMNLIPGFKSPVNKSLVNSRDVGTFETSQNGSTDNSFKEKAYIMWEDKLLESQGKTPDGGFVFRKSPAKGSVRFLDTEGNSLDSTSDAAKHKIDRPLELLNSSLQSCLSDGRKAVDPIEAFMKMADNSKVSQMHVSNSVHPEEKSPGLEKIANIPVQTPENSITAEREFVNNIPQMSDSTSVIKSYSQVLNVPETVSPNNRVLKTYSQVLHPNEPVKNDIPIIKSYSQALSKPVEKPLPANDIQRSRHVSGISSCGKVSLSTNRPREISEIHFSKITNESDSSANKTNSAALRDKFFKERVNYSNREVTPTPTQNSRNVQDSRWQRREIVSILKKEADIPKGVSSKRASGSRVGKPISRSADPCGIIDEIMKQGKPVEIIQTSACGEYFNPCVKNSASNSNGKGDVPAPKAITGRPLFPQSHHSQGVASSKVTSRANESESGDGGKSLSGFAGLTESNVIVERGRGRGQTRGSIPLAVGPCRRPVAPPFAPGCHR